MQKYQFQTTAFSGKTGLLAPMGELYFMLNPPSAPTLLPMFFLTECVWVKVKCNSVVTIKGSCS